MLTDNLVSYWKLEESSGTRNDEVGSNDLDDSASSVGAAAGIIGNGGQFVRANTEFLSIPSASQSPDLSINGANGDITIAGWVELATTPAGQMYAFSKYSFANALREYAVYWDNTADRFQFIVFDSTTNFNLVVANNFGEPATSVRYFIVAWVDNTANTINIQINDGTLNSSSLTITTHNGGAPFMIGSAGSIASPYGTWDGIIDEVGVWSRVLTSDERTQLYNAGAGLTYPFTGGAPAQNSNFLALLGV